MRVQLFEGTVVDSFGNRRTGKLGKSGLRVFGCRAIADSGAKISGTLSTKEPLVKDREKHHCIEERAQLLQGIEDVGAIGAGWSCKFWRL